MRTGKIIGIVLVCLITGAMLDLLYVLPLGTQTFVSAQGGEVTVSIKAPATVSPGGEFVATVDISDVKNFDSAVYDVTYDPAVLEVTAVAQGTINNIEVPVDMWDFIPSGVQGRVRILNNIPAFPGVSGSGYLAEIHFHVIGSSGDASSLSFILEESNMADNTAANIQANWVGCYVHIAAAVSLPTPTATHVATEPTPPPSSPLPTWIYGAIAAAVVIIVVVPGLLLVNRRIAAGRVVNARVKQLRAKMEKWRAEGYDVSELEDLFK